MFDQLTFSQMTLPNSALTSGIDLTLSLALRKRKAARGEDFASGVTSAGLIFPTDQLGLHRTRY